VSNVDIYTIALCAGYGGLEIGLAAACEFVGWQSRVAAYVEREAYAAALIASRMEAGALDAAPIWSDLVTFDAAAWRGAVDCITAGFPCQPHSHAGKRKGTDDERWIWPDIRRIVRESGAWLVVLENVTGLLSSGGFDDVLRDLAEDGFDAEWLVLPAAAAGAAHRRERVFIVAYSARIRRGERAGRERIFDGGSSLDNAAIPRLEGIGAVGVGVCVADSGRDALADAERERIERWRITSVVGGSPRPHEGDGDKRQRIGNAAGDCGARMADAFGNGRQRFPNRGGAGYEAQHDARSEASGASRALFAPGPADERWPDILAATPWLAPAFEPGIRVLADGSAAVVDEYRAHQLRCGGNGVVPLQAAAAIVELFRRIGIASGNSGGRSVTAECGNSARHD